MGMYAVAAFVCVVCLVPPGDGLPFIPDWLGELEISLPTGEEGVWKLRSAEAKVEDRLRQVLKDMANDSQERAPGGAMEDPLTVPASLEQSAAGATFKLNNIALTGHRQYQVPSVHVDLAKHEYEYELRFARLATLGQYVLDYYWTAAEGDFTITMHEVTARGRGLLHLAGNGSVQLNAGHSHTEVTYARIEGDLGSPGLVDSVAQTALSILGPYLFDLLKPSTVYRINEYLAKHTHLHIRELDEERLLDGSLAVVDSHVLAARRQIRQAGYDPLELPDMSRAHSGVEVLLTHGVLTGLSSLRRRGDVALGVLDQKAKATLSLGTERVTGKYRWAVRGFDLLERSGFIQFSVDGVELRARLAQAISLRQRPTIEDIDIDLGRLTVRSEGLGSLDYALNIGSQSFPSMIKNILVQAIEAPIVWIIENQFNELGFA